MERKIGEIFEFNGEWYQCVRGETCADCAFVKKHCNENPLYKAKGGCSCYRKDATPVIFKKLEKVGEVIEYNGSFYQGYKVMDTAINVCKLCAFGEISCGEAVVCKKGVVYKGIKQTKKDMEDINNPNFSNTKKIGKNLKPFDLQAAKAGKPVCTRSGKPVRIICFDSKNDPRRPIVALVEHNDNELLYEYTIEGKERFSHISTTGTSDLMMLPEKKEGWVNVSKFSIYASKEEALSHKTYDIISTVKVEWYE